MDVTATLDAACPPEQLYAWVDALDRYPEWLDIVPVATPAEPAEGDPGPAWVVELRGRLGPFARSKRLRMVRTEHTPPHRVRFERRELDGRVHSPWVLDAEVHEPDAATTGRSTGASGGGATLEIRLHYGGALWGPMLERLLRDEIERSRPRLRACAEG